MKPESAGILVLSALMIIIFPGCMQEQGIDKAKLSAVNRTMLDIKDVLASPNPCEMPEVLMQRLKSETAALRDAAVTMEEHNLLANYADLLAVCRDGLLICRSRTHLTAFRFVPQGRIYVTQELDPVIEKYGLQTKRHLYVPTGLYWKSIDYDSIKVIWKAAETRIRNIENMVNYN